jgi:hypothetical protein
LPCAPDVVRFRAIAVICGASSKLAWSILTHSDRLPSSFDAMRKVARSPRRPADIDMEPTMSPYEGSSGYRKFEALRPPLLRPH